MGRCRFVQPDIVRIPISDGDFIDVKKQLNSGEKRGIYSALVKPGLGFGEKPTLDPHLVGRTEIEAYLVGWSLVDAEGKPVPVSAAAIDNLDTDAYGEIAKAIDEHDRAATAAMEAKKKTKTGSPESDPISSSVE